MNQMSIAEICAELGISESTARRRIIKHIRKHEIYTVGKGISVRYNREEVYARFRELNTDKVNHG